MFFSALLFLFVSKNTYSKEKFCRDFFFNRNFTGKEVFLEKARQPFLFCCKNRSNLLTQSKIFYQFLANFGTAVSSFSFFPAVALMYAVCKISFDSLIILLVNNTFR